MPVLALSPLPLLPGALVLVFRRQLAALLAWIVPERFGALRRLVRLETEKQRVAVWVAVGCGWTALGLVISVPVIAATVTI